MTYFEKIVDVATGKETLRPYTSEEIAKVEAAIADNEAKDQAKAIKEAAKADLLAKLGITADEAALLLG